MTLMQTQVEPEFVLAPPVPSVRRPKYSEVIAAIVAEAGCTERKADQVYQFLARARDCIRSWSGGEEEGYQDFMYHLTDSDIARVHDVLDLIMPDDAVAADGSAFALLNRRLLSGRELTFVHTKDGQVIVDCTVAIQINVA